MGGKLGGFLVMALAALLAWKWLRAQRTGGGRPPPATRRDAPREKRPEDVITLERDPETGVYRPTGENDHDRS